MAGALIKFNGGWMGFERCTDPKDDSQYLRATIYTSSQGRTVSGPVTLAQVFEFASESVRQALLADGHSEDEIKEIAWSSH